MRRITHFRPSPAMVVAVIALLVALGGIAAASIPGKGGVITACYLKTGGSLRVLNTSRPGASGRCQRNERTLTWNQLGRQGIRGKQGIQGVKGHAGPPGPTEGTSADFFSNTSQNRGGGRHQGREPFHHDPGRARLRVEIHRFDKRDLHHRGQRHICACGRRHPRARFVRCQCSQRQHGQQRDAHRCHTDRAGGRPPYRLDRDCLRRDRCDELKLCRGPGRDRGRARLTLS